jgi:protein TonB
MRKTNQIRLILFIAAAAVHLLLILFFAVTMDPVVMTRETPAAVMKLTDFEEEIPPPPPPPPPPESAPPVPDNAVESIAETMIETEEVPEDQVLVEPGTLIVSQAPPPVQAAESEEEYFPMHKISVRPVFPDRDILASLVYPPIALRSGIEGTAYLELFIDRRGEIKQITILKEDPPNRGFGEAAVNAFRGIKGKPAEANGVPVAVRFRYPVRFKIKG